MQNVKKNWYAVSKLTRIWWKLTRVLKSLIKHLHFLLFLLCKVFDVWQKMYSGVIFHYTEVWCKIWRKTDLWFGKRREEYGRFLPEHLKVSNLGLCWDPLIQSRKSMSLKFKEDLCVMTKNNDTKTEQELTCCFKIDMRNITNFDPITQKSKKFVF